MILVIDDSDEERGLIRRMLEGEGYDVREAAGGVDGLELFETLRPALVICDLMMPDRDGFDTVREMQERIPGIKIVAVSGVLFGAVDPAAMADSLGLAAVIEKPFRHAQLLAVVRAAIGP